MGGVCYIGPRLGDGLVFEVDVKECYPRHLIILSALIPILLCKFNNFNNDHVRLIGFIKVPGSEFN